MNTNNIIRAFHSYNPSLIVKAIYNAPNGYLIIASEIKDEIDYNDPNYFMSNTGRIEEYLMSNMNDFFKIIESDPIYKIY